MRCSVPLKKIPMQRNLFIFYLDNIIPSFFVQFIHNLRLLCHKFLAHPLKAPLYTLHITPLNNIYLDHFFYIDIATKSN